LNSIKKSFANCSICPLLKESSCILETNCEKDLTKVDVVFVAENPAKDEVKKGIPLIGKSGKKFRSYFKKYNLNKMKYLLTNIVLCQTTNPDGTTGNPEPEVIEICKTNCFNIINQCNPKLVVIMGTSPMRAFDLGDSGITNKRGSIVKKEIMGKEYSVLITVHPSFVNRNPSYDAKFESDIKTSYELVSGKTSSHEVNKDISATNKKGMYKYKIPKKFYTDEYRLVDIQFLNKSSEILYIFRDRNNKKVTYKCDDRYICYMVPSGVEARKIVPYDKLNQVSILYRDKVKLNSDVTYEGDMKLTMKHAVDYYMNNQGEAPKVNSNIMYADIEVDTGDNKEFPNQKEAKYPINMITTIFRGETITYVIDNQTEPINKIKGVKMNIFKDEKSLMFKFIKDFKLSDPDFMTGWNFINFDMDYIFNRLPKLKINPASFSKFGDLYVDGSRGMCNMPGCIILDQCALYKQFTFTKKENYKLGFISEVELGVTKIDLPLPINEMYWKMLNRTIEYNIRDSELLEKLENKLMHINLLNEIREICTTSFDSGASQFGQVDSLMINFLKRKGMASKNSNPHIKKEKYPGAFVYEPEPGIYDNIVDFDFTSLYPSIIMTYNIGVNNFKMKLKDPKVGYDLANKPVAQWPKAIDVIKDPLHKAQNVVLSPEELAEIIKVENLIHTINGCFFTNHNESVSVYSEVLQNLLSSRRAYKNKMLEAKESGDKAGASLNNTRQLVYKVLANALYGVIANKAFRFFDVSCAGAVTLSGQEALKNSIIYGDYFMEYLNSGKNKQCNPITKKEMYDKVMPERKTKYIITGDTDSIFCCFEYFNHEVTIENIQGWCKQIQTYLNEKIIPPIVLSHNASLETNKLDLKNELIISRGLFLAKKRYCIHVVNQEGKNVDESVYMGVEIKRSDYPSKSKEFMKEVVDLIFKADKVSINQLMDYVNRKEREFRQLIKSGDKSIAKPVSYGRKLKDYKSIPQGVKAMENFNKISYRAHVVGSKAYLFHVAGIDLQRAPKDVIKNYGNFIKNGGKLDVVAIPDEESKLPSYYIPDIKGNLRFAFKERHALLLAPLMPDMKKPVGILTI